MSWRETLITLLAADERAVKKIDQLDQRQREIGHDINNIRMKLDPLERLIRELEEREGKEHG